MTASLHTVPLRLSVHDLSRRGKLRSLELEWHGAERRLRLVDEDDPTDVICEAIAPELSVENGAIDWDDRWLVVSGWRHPTQQAAAFYACIQADMRASDDASSREDADVDAEPEMRSDVAGERVQSATDDAPASTLLLLGSPRKHTDPIAWPYRAVASASPDSSSVHEPLDGFIEPLPRRPHPVGHPLHFGFSA
jgi:hypothetical protein